MGTKSLGAIASTFATDTDGWTIQGDVQSFNWQQTGGNPDGSLHWVDAATGAVAYYDASSAFLGNDSAFYGGSLSYDIEDTGSDLTGYPDVEITGAGMTLVATLGQAGTTWTHRSVSLDTSANWTIGTSSGAIATAAQIQAVLRNLTDLEVRAEYVNGDESGGLDNVVMTTAGTAGAKIWLGAGETWNTGADWTGGTAPGVNDKVLVTEGDPQITANVTLKGRFGEGSGGTVTLAGGYLSLKGTSSLSGIVNGSSKLYDNGTMSVSGLMVGGTVQLANYGTLTEAGGSLTLGDSSGASASINNVAGATFDITDDSGIGLGSSTASPIVNAGLFEKTGGSGISTIAPRVANNNAIAVTSGTLDFEGMVSGTGGVSIGNGATLAFESSVAAGQTASFSGASATLDVDAYATFHATVAGFSGGDTIDLAGLSAAGETYSYKPNAGDTGGQLKIVSGSSKAYVTFSGAYGNANFSLSDDTHGGTAISYVLPA